MPDPVTLANAVGWGISVLGWVISPIMSKLVNKGLSYLGDVAGSSANNLQNLEEKVQRLQLTLEAAQVSPDAEKKLEGWLKKLKSAFYDAEDILDVIDYDRLHGQALLHPANTTKQKATTKKDFIPRWSKKELKETLKRVDDLIDEGNNKVLPLLHLTTSSDNIKSSQKQTTESGSLSSSSQTTSEPPEIFGRDGDKEKIRSMLSDTPDDHFAIVIHGIAGSGKTTLAQYVCECEKKKFELFMWIHVTENFNVRTVYKEMLEIASGQEMGSLSNLDRLQSELKKRLKGKRLLLVLDDVWYSERVVEQDKLKKLLSPLKEAGKGSRVLITSRTAGAANLLLDVAHHLEPISDMNEEEFFKMFMHYALDNSTVSDQATRSQFETTGKDIAALLGRSPLAARAVAGHLRTQRLRFWKHTLNQKHGLLNNDIMGPLWWSYHQLEGHVRQCFAYCSMFPRRYELRRDELVQMWMAQGFVGTGSNSDMEFVAHKCIDVLLSTSFIQLKHMIGDQEYYTVHDLLHDLAERVSGSDCFRIEKDTVDHQIPEDVRHLFIDSDDLGDLMKQIVERETLRTLVMSSSAKQITAEDFKCMLKHLKKLRFVRVLLEEFGENVIPGCIGGLKHLRFLGLIGSTSDADRGIDLPPEFTKLYHLQELSVPLVFRVHCPPDSDHMANLKNLWRIGGPWMNRNTPHIGRMPQLQTMGDFTVKKEKGYEITQLEKLNSIRGHLRIKGLGNIESKEDARGANLSEKLDVSTLSLDWENEESSRKKQKTAAGHHQQVVVTPKPEEILEALHPPAQLVQLFIRNYGGLAFPSWLSGEDGELNLLECLEFDECHGSGSQFRFSKPLPKLKILSINRCSWNALPDNIELLPSLEKLQIGECPNIQSPPGLPSSLERLEIQDCPNISTLPELPPYLEELVIYDCKNIQSPPRLPSSLKKLWIEHCPNISILPHLPRSLKKLQCDQYLVDSYPDRQAFGRIKIKDWFCN